MARLTSPDAVDPDWIKKVPKKKMTYEEMRASLNAWRKAEEEKEKKK